MKEYEVYYRCSNCYFECRVKVPYGRIAEFVYDCPNCGTGWLKKTEKENLGPWYRVKGERLVTP